MRRVMDCGTQSKRSSGWKLICSTSQGHSCASSGAMIFLVILQRMPTCKGRNDMRFAVCLDMFGSRSHACCKISSSRASSAWVDQVHRLRVVEKLPLWMKEISDASQAGTMSTAPCATRCWRKRSDDLHWPPSGRVFPSDGDAGREG